jgi:hypothetical protein
VNVDEIGSKVAHAFRERQETGPRQGHEPDLRERPDGQAGLPGSPDQLAAGVGEQGRADAPLSQAVEQVQHLMFAAAPLPAGVDVADVEIGCMPRRGHLEIRRSVAGSIRRGAGANKTGTIGVRKDD